MLVVLVLMAVVNQREEDRAVKTQIRRENTVRESSWLMFGVSAK